MATEDQPQDPFGRYTQAAVNMHEMFASFVSAGFKRAEALQLVITIIQGSQSQGGK